MKYKLLTSFIITIFILTISLNLPSVSSQTVPKVTDDNSIYLKSRVIQPRTGIDAPTLERLQQVPKERIHVLLALDRIPKNAERIYDI